MMRTSILIPTVLLLAFGCVAYGEDPWADNVVIYAPISVSVPYNDASKCLGAPLGGGATSPNNDSLTSLGTQGGSITLAFDTPVTDDAENPMGLDCIVFSNAFYSGGNPQKKWQEPALIEISEDVNDNGVADDPWYLIPGSRGFAYSPFPAVSEPAGADNDSPFSSDLLAGTIRNPNSTDGDSGNDEVEYNWGYAEMTPTAAPYLDNYLRPDDPYAVGVTARSGGGDAFDIAWAVDAAGGPAGITQFHFIRLTSFIDRDFDGLGSCSPDIEAVADVAPDVDTDGDGIVDDYEIRVAGTDPARPESTVLPLEIPVLEGGSSPGDLLGKTSKDDIATIKLYADETRIATPRNFNCTVDLVASSDPGGTLSGGLLKSAAACGFVSSESDFVAAEIQPAEMTIYYARPDIAGLNELSLAPWRYEDGGYTQSGISDVEIDPAANSVTFRSRYAGVFLLASTAGAGDAYPADPSQYEGVPISWQGMALLALALLAAGLMAQRRMHA